MRKSTFSWSSWTLYQLTLSFQKNILDCVPWYSLATRSPSHKIRTVSHLTKMMTFKCAIFLGILSMCICGAFGCDRRSVERVYVNVDTGKYSWLHSKFKKKSWCEVGGIGGVLCDPNYACCPSIQKRITVQYLVKMKTHGSHNSVTFMAHICSRHEFLDVTDTSQLHCRWWVCWNAVIFPGSFICI